MPRPAPGCPTSCDLSYALPQPAITLQKVQRRLWREQRDHFTLHPLDSLPGAPLREGNSRGPASPVRSPRAHLLRETQGSGAEARHDIKVPQGDRRLLRPSITPHSPAPFSTALPTSTELSLALAEIPARDPFVNSACWAHLRGEGRPSEANWLDAGASRDPFQPGGPTSMCCVALGESVITATRVPQ